MGISRFIQDGLSLLSLNHNFPPVDDIDAWREFVVHFLSLQVVDAVGG